jgi:hypothetical protein
MTISRLNAQLTRAFPYTEGKPIVDGVAQFKIYTYSNPELEKLAYDSLRTTYTDETLLPEERDRAAERLMRTISKHKKNRTVIMAKEDDGDLYGNE